MTRLIDADVFEKHLEDKWILHEISNKSLEQIGKWLAQEQTADAVPVRHGKWIPVTNGRGGFECNQCHCYAPSYQDGVEWLSAFCPNCGADMRGTDNDSV